MVTEQVSVLSDGYKTDTRSIKRERMKQDLYLKLSEWCGKGVTVQLEVFVVLGKALIDRKLTMEGKWRLFEGIRLTHVRRRPEVHPLVIFTGWAGDPPASQSEGRLLEQCFRLHEMSYGFEWPGALIAEEEARTTVENILKAMEILDGVVTELRKMFPFLRIVILRFHIMSSDYHIDRMWEVDEYLFELTDLKPLRERGHEVRPVRAPYLFVSCGDPVLEWLAEGYLQMHKLTLLQVNLLGLGGNLNQPTSARQKSVDPGTVGELRRVPFERIVTTIQVLSDLLSRSPDLKQIPRGVLRTKVEMACAEIPGAIEQMQQLENDLRPHVGKSYTEVSAQPWVDYHQRLSQMSRMLRTEILDPDQPAPGLL